MRKVTNGAEFRSAMGKIADLTKDDNKKVIQKLALDSFASLLQLTAKDTGYARNNWSVAIDAPAPDGDLVNGDKSSFPDPSPPPVIKRARYNSVVTLYNNTRYIKFLEEGTPDMEAQPMVEPTKRKLYAQAEQLCLALSIKKYGI